MAPSRAGVSGLAIFEIIAGLVVAWAGVQNVPVATVVRSLARGKLPPAGAPGDYVAGGTAGATSPGTAGSNPDPGTAGSGVLSGGLGGTGADNGCTASETAKNQILGRTLAAAYGWASGENWEALNYGWGHLESGWCNRALNEGSAGNTPENAAYGIAQADPGSKYPAGGLPPVNSAAVQITWGLKYIKDTYGSPSQVPGWLGQGGYVGY